MVIESESHNDVAEIAPLNEPSLASIFPLIYAFSALKPFAFTVLKSPFSNFPVVAYTFPLTEALLDSHSDVALTEPLNEPLFAYTVPLNTPFVA